MNKQTQTAPVQDEYRTRLTIHNGDVHVSFHLNRNGSGEGMMVLISLGKPLDVRKYAMTDRQQSYYANEINYRLFAEEGDIEASFDGIAAWLDAQHTIERL